jgi:hypothetical protein
LPTTELAVGEAADFDRAKAALDATYAELQAKGMLKAAS